MYAFLCIFDCFKHFGISHCAVFKELKFIALDRRAFRQKAVKSAVKVYSVVMVPVVIVSVLALFRKIL